MEHSSMEASDTHLINAIKNCPALYDPRHPDFKITVRKEEVWEQTAKFLGISVSDLKRRWTCLRDRYTRELKQMKKTGRMHERSQFFNRMNFLKDYIRARSERRSIVCKIDSDSLNSSNSIMSHKIYESSHEDHEIIDIRKVEKSSDDENQIEIQHQIEMVDYVHGETDSNAEFNIESYEYAPESPVSQPSKVQYKIQPKKSMDDDSIALRVDSPMEETEIIRTSCEQETEDDYFCKSIAGYLKTLSRMNKISAKVEIYQTIQKFVELEEKK